MPFTHAVVACTGDLRYWSLPDFRSKKVRRCESTMSVVSASLMGVVKIVWTDREKGKRVLWEL